MRGTVLYRASSYYCDQPSSFSQAPSACGVQCPTERLVYAGCGLGEVSTSGVALEENIAKEGRNGGEHRRR